MFILQDKHVYMGAAITQKSEFCTVYPITEKKDNISGKPVYNSTKTKYALL